LGLAGERGHAERVDAANHAPHLTLCGLSLPRNKTRSHRNRAETVSNEAVEESCGAGEQRQRHEQRRREAAPY
jgi:hypothetical protein